MLRGDRGRRTATGLQGFGSSGSSANTVSVSPPYFSPTSQHAYFLVSCLSAHLSWVAPALRRCLEMSSASQLQIELFVSRTATSARPQRPPSHPYEPSDELAPPTAPFARTGPASRSSMDSDMSDSESELPSRQMYSNIGLEDDGAHNVTDMVLFDGAHFFSGCR